MSIPITPHRGHLEPSLRHEIEVFFDGQCPLCVREMRLLRRLDQRASIRFTDISDPGFVPERLGLSYATLMARIHGRRSSDGALLEGVEVFRELYSAVGFRRLVAMSRWPLISPLLGLAYHWFAKNRLRLTGRCHDGLCEAHPKA